MFKAEFERRLLRLYKAIDSYYCTGKVGNIMPSLWSCFSYLWSFKAEGVYKKK